LLLELAKAVLALNKPTVIVLFNGGMVAVEEEMTSNNPNVAIIEVSWAQVLEEEGRRRGGGRRRRRRKILRRTTMSELCILSFTLYPTARLSTPERWAARLSAICSSARFRRVPSCRIRSTKRYDCSFVRY
jgi:hypothetical protein